MLNDFRAYYIYYRRDLYQSPRRALRNAWRTVEKPWRRVREDTDVHTAVWPLLIAAALGYVGGALSMAFIAGLLAVWRRNRDD